MQSDNHFFFPHFSVKDLILHADFLFVLIIIKSDHIIIRKPILKDKLTRMRITIR